MNNKLLPLAWLLSLGLSLSGCSSSPPNNYYLLSANEFPVVSGDTPTLGIGPTEIPEYLSRANLVYNRMDNRLQVASQDLWAEPLGDGIQRVLVLNLSGLLNTQHISYFPWHPERAPEYAVKVSLLQLDATENEAALTAEWLVYRPASAESVNRGISRLLIPLSPGAPEPERVAGAYSALLFQLSEILAAAITKDQVEGSNTAASRSAQP
jgi:uncharacterized lipoprotein YmbA